MFPFAVDLYPNLFGSRGLGCKIQDSGFEGVGLGFRMQGSGVESCIGTHRWIYRLRSVFGWRSLGSQSCGIIP